MKNGQTTYWDEMFENDMSGKRIIQDIKKSFKTQYLKASNSVRKTGKRHEEPFHQGRCVDVK